MKREHWGSCAVRIIHGCVSSVGFYPTMEGVYAAHDPFQNASNRRLHTVNEHLLMRSELRNAHA